MAGERQRGADIDLAEALSLLKDADGNVVPGGVCDRVREGEAMMQLVDSYKLANLVVDSDGSDSDSQAGSVVSEGESAEEDRDQVTVNTDSFDAARIREQLEGNVAENPEQELDQVRGFNCGCSYFDDEPCYRQFSEQEIVDSRMTINEMTEGKLSYISFVDVIRILTLCVIVRLTLT